jgi:carbonyl reductase 1
VLQCLRVDQHDIGTERASLALRVNRNYPIGDSLPILVRCGVISFRTSGQQRILGCRYKSPLIAHRYRSNPTDSDKMSSPLVIVVTGSSRGIGKGITTVLAQQDIGRPMTVYATSRSGNSNNVEESHSNTIKYAKLDTTDRASIDSFFAQAVQGHGAVDVLINNAAMVNESTSDHAEQTVWNNYGGTRDMCDAFLSQPNLRPGARIVSMTSGLNNLSSYGAAIQTSIRNASSVADIDAIAKAYVADMRAGPEVEARAGWADKARSYKVSKALINTLTVVLAKQHPDVMINSCCPGWVNTDMGKMGGATPPKTPEEGARTAVRCAIGNLGVRGDEDGGLGKESERSSGRFYENENIMVPGWGKSKLWMEL